MRCFYHGDADAVAICKSCGHALCHDCCAEVGSSAACRNRCEDDVAALNEMIQRNKTSFQKASGAYLRSGLLLCVLGVAFAVFGATMRGDGGPVYFLVVMGGLFFIYGFSQLFTARRFNSK
jgi:hypothetical protein